MKKAISTVVLALLAAFAAANIASACLCCWYQPTLPKK